MKQVLSYLCLLSLMLIACAVLDTAADEAAPPTASPATSTAAVQQPDEEQEPLPTLPPTATAVPSFTDVTADGEVTDEAVIDPVIQEADRLLCENIAESEAEIEEMAAQGLDVTELIEALEELKEEVGTCSD